MLSGGVKCILVLNRGIVNDIRGDHIELLEIDNEDYVEFEEGLCNAMAGISIWLSLNELIMCTYIYMYISINN